MIVEIPAEPGGKLQRIDTGNGPVFVIGGQGQSFYIHETPQGVFGITAANGVHGRAHTVEIRPRTPAQFELRVLG